MHDNDEPVHLGGNTCVVNCKMNSWLEVCNTLKIVQDTSAMATHGVLELNICLKMQMAASRPL